MTESSNLHLRPLPPSASSAPQPSPMLPAIAALATTEVSPMVAVLILSADNESHRLHKWKETWVA